MNTTTTKHKGTMNIAWSIAIIVLIFLGYITAKPSMLSLLKFSNEPGKPTLSLPLTGTTAPAVLLLNADALVATLNGGTVNLAARVRDTEGNAVPGVTVHFSSAQGSVAPDNAVTGADGVANAAFTAGNREGQAVVTVEVDGLTREAAIQIVKPNNDATAHSLTLQPSALKLDLGQEMKVIATLRDGTGQPLVGEVVSMFGSMGEVSPASVVSDGSGRVTFTYRAGNFAGQAMITVLAGYASASSTLQVGPANVPGVLDQKQFLPMMARQ